MSKNVDVVVLRRRLKRRRRMLKLLMFLVVLGVALLVYSKRDTWFPKLQGIGSRYQNITRNEESNGTFELAVSGGVEYFADFVQSDLFILCDKYLYIYSADGTLLDSRQHAYSNAAMKTSGSRVLLYSINGTNFRVDSRNKEQYELTTDQPIWFGVISEDGRVAIVTESETYACRLTVYDTNGKVIYTRECVERLSDVSFSGDGCIFSTIGASGGELITTLQCISFDENDVKWTTAPLPTLCLQVFAMQDGGAFVIGDTKAAYYTSTGALAGSYDYNAEMTDFAFSEDKGAVLLKNEERRQSVLLLFSDRSAAPATVQLDSIARNVILDGETAYLLSGSSIRSFAFSGQEMKATSVTDAYDRILRYGKYFYLLGYDKIHRIES